MEVYVRDQQKLTEIWLTKQEKQDAALRRQLVSFYTQYSKAGYTVAVFLSGEEELYQQTRDLLLCNRRRLAEKEVQAEKQAGMARGS